jgi:hypothetical protein
MVSALLPFPQRRLMTMLASYNNDPNQYNWIKILSNLFWLLIFLSVLAGIVRTVTEQ